MVARALGETSGMICSRTSPWITEPALDFATGCTPGVSETLVRVAGAGVGVLGECLSLVFSNDGVACDGRGEDGDEACSVGVAGFGADLEAFFVCATAGIGFIEGDEDGSMVAAGWTGARRW